LDDLTALEQWFTRTDLFAVNPPSEGLTGSGLQPVTRLLCGDGGSTTSTDAPGTTAAPGAEVDPDDGAAAPGTGVTCVTPGADGRPRVASPDTYASAFALLARQGGFDVRLATGARTAPTGSLVADAQSVAVWPEVRF